MDSFELFNYSIGDTDITKGDGIYSRYITTITAAGHYWLTISASDNNGRAKVLYGRNSKSTPRNLTTNYFIKYFDKRGDVLNRFDEDVSKIIDVWNINGPPLVPESYGTEQKVLVDLHDIQQDKIFYFGIQGVDEAGNKGIVSNVVAVFFSSNSVSPTVSHSFSLDSTMSSSTQDPAADKKIKLNKTGLSTGNIALTVSFVLLLLIIILVLLVLFCKRKSKNKKRPNQSCSKPLKSEKDAVDNVDFGYGVKEEHVTETLLKPINPSPAEAVV